MTAAPPAPSGLRRRAGQGAAATLAQALTAGTSLLLQITAARALGLAEFGAFTVFLGILTSLSALYTGWVGDSLAVLDRHDARTRAGLVTSALAGWGLSTVVGLCAVAVRGDGWLAGVVYAGMLVCWLAEETVRRLLIARLEFWKLVGNDAVYLLATTAALLALAVTGGITLTALFAAMGVGAGTAVLAGLVQLPRSELRRLRPGTAGLGTVAAFGSWRAAQSALRPLSLLGARLLVSSLLALAAVGALEAGRLVVAPLQVVLNGAGSALLAGFAASRGGTARAAIRASWTLAVTTLLGGAVLVALADPVGTLLTGEAVSYSLVLSWAVYLVVWAAGLPLVAAVTARRRSREVFTIRVVDSVVGLVLVAAALSLGAGLHTVPLLMAAAGLYSLWRLHALLPRCGDVDQD